MRASFVKLHRALGLFCGAVVFLVCLSGALLSFQDELTQVLNRDLIHESDVQVSAQEMLISAQAQLLDGEFVHSIYLPLGKVRVQGPSGKRILFFHPADGRFLGQGSKIFVWVLALHRNLLLTDFGRWLTLTSCLALIGLLISGWKLWWPRKLSKISKGLRIKTTASRRRLVFDLHRVLGIFISIPLLMIAVTGLNFTKIKGVYRDTIVSLTRAEPIPAPKPVGQLGPERLSLDQALAISMEVFPQATATAIQLPGTPDGPLNIRFRHPSQPGTYGRSNVVLHPETGEILRSLNGMEMSFGQQLIHVWAFPLHRGRVFGLLHQLLWAVVALLGASLPVSGFWLWYTRRSRNRG
jgi:uncharacterized iron-regulated membrane protein